MIISGLSLNFVLLWR